MKVSESFSYPFEDVQWPTKLGVGGLMSLVPILNFAVVGYEVGIVRNVAAGASEPLPQWDDLGNKWRDGLILTLAGLVYGMPVLLALAVLLALLGASGALSQGSTAGTGRTLMASNVAVLACFLIVLVVYSLVLSLIRPVILVVFSKEGTFASCFRLREIFRVIHQLPGPFITTWLVIIAAGLVVGLIVGLINAVIGWIPCIGWTAGALLAIGTAMYLLTVDGYILGQFRLAAFEQGTEPLSPLPA